MDELLDTAPCGFVTFADDGTVRLVNATLLEVLGRSREEVVGRHVEGILTVAGRIFYQTHLFPLLALHGRAEEIFLLLRTRTGEDVGTLVNAVRRERDGEPVTDCVLMVVRERRRYEDALLQARRDAERAQDELEARSMEAQRANDLLEKQAVELEVQHQQLQEQATELEAQAEELDRQRRAAEEANQAKSQFLATMSHELRTPLNAIAGYTQLIELGIHGPVTDAQHEALRRIERSQRHLLRLINDVLNLARIEAGRVDYDITDVPLAGLVASVTPMVEPQLASRGLVLEVEVAPALVARTDRDKLQQILLNLLGNAIKFTPRGGRVRVDASEGEGVPGTVFLHVHDTGVGIPADRLASVFEPFVQVDASHAGRREGTGLGLAISRDLALGMGGDLRARSTEGEGSTFSIVLPRAGG